MELDTRAAPASGAGNAPGQRVWAYRKAAWAIEDLEQDVGLIYRQMGRKGLEAIENVGPRMAEVIEKLLSAGYPELQRRRYDERGNPASTAL